MAEWDVRPKPQLVPVPYSVDPEDEYRYDFVHGVDLSSYDEKEDAVFLAGYKKYLEQQAAAGIGVDHSDGNL
jgi:GH25 family lysozyme M1 (1,4-beta-N-acetylmuramidase)